MKRYLGALAILFASMLWALDGAFLRPSLYSLNSILVVFLEHSIAFAFMFPLLMFEIKELKKMDKGDWWVMVLIALFGGAIGTITITEAYFGVFIYNMSSISTVTILQKTQPIFAVILARLILKEKMKDTFFLWFGVAVLGSYLTIFGSDRFSFQALYVPLFALLAAVSFATGTVLGRKVLFKINNRVATYLRFGLTMVLTFIILVAFSAFNPLKSPDAGNIWTLLLIAFTTGGVAIMIYYWGLKKTKASKATILELGYPVTAFAIDYFVRGHTYTLTNWIGVILILVAMYMVVRNK